MEWKVLVVVTGARGTAAVRGEHCVGAGRWVSAVSRKLWAGCSGSCPEGAASGAASCCAARGDFGPCAWVMGPGSSSYSLLPAAAEAGAQGVLRGPERA